MGRRPRRGQVLHQPHDLADRRSGDHRLEAARLDHHVRSREALIGAQLPQLDIQASGFLLELEEPATHQILAAFAHGAGRR